MVNQSIYPAPAKINLFLHVTGKRADGYHEIETAFQFLDYADELRFSINNSGQITRSYDLGLSEQEDICLRAAHLLKSFAGPECGVDIALLKRLPVGGGLGGGSSDAATTLLALNHFWQLRLERERLAALGLQLGADVPVFVMGQAAWAGGIGERLTPAEFPQQWYLVVTPDIAVSTAEVFAHKQLTPRPQPKKIRALKQGVDALPGDNQLEPLVRSEYPQVNALLEWLCEFGPARMSGSGGSVFLPLSDQQQGLELLSIKPSNSTGFVARGLNVHPLRDAFD